MVITTPPKADIAATFARLIGERAGIVYPGAQMHTPTNVTEAALTAVSSVQADGILAIGGGSAIGLSKAIALRTDLPQIVIPTTFAGSEMTPILGETERGVKVTQTSPKILPETVIYDPDLLAGAAAHRRRTFGDERDGACGRGALCANANPMISLMAEEAIRALGGALPRLLADAGDRAAWSDALYGAWLAGTCVGTVGMGMHHKICHTLGGAFDLNHADVHCVMLPYTAAFNGEAAPEAMRRVARALGADEAPGALYDLMQRAATVKSLKADGIDHGRARQGRRSRGQESLRQSAAGDARRRHGDPHRRLERRAGR